MAFRDGLLLAVLSFIAASSANAFGQEISGDAQNKKALTKLPKPPEWIEKLIKNAKVKFTTGGQAVTNSKSYRVGRRRLGAETRFSLKYDYRTRSNWTVQGSGQNKKLVITIDIDRANLIGTHEVWFRKTPDLDGFWDNPLVLHELDHVRISNDPRIEKQFQTKLRQNTKITKPFSDFTSDGRRVNESLVRQTIDLMLKEIFDETVELVQIRYKELDRQTDHGLRPVPKDSEVEKWLSKP